MMLDAKGDDEPRTVVSDEHGLLAAELLTNKEIYRENLIDDECSVASLDEMKRRRQC